MWVPWVAKVLNNVKCSTSVEKSYIMMTAIVILYDGTLAPKTDRFRGEGSNSLVKLIRGRIGSARIGRIFFLDEVLELSRKNDGK